MRRPRAPLEGAAGSGISSHFLSQIAVTFLSEQTASEGLAQLSNSKLAAASGRCFQLSHVTINQMLLRSRERGRETFQESELASLGSFGRSMRTWTVCKYLVLRYYVVVMFVFAFAFIFVLAFFLS